MGQYLLSHAGNDLYTIGVFAGQGRAMEVEDNALVPFVRRAIRPASKYDVESLLSKLSSHDFILDLATAGERPRQWFVPATTRWEPRRTAIVALAKDFHAAVFIQEIHSGELRFLPSKVRLILDGYGLVLDHAFVLIGAGLALTCLVVIAVVRRRKTGRSKRAIEAPAG